MLNQLPYRSSRIFLGSGAGNMIYVVDLGHLLRQWQWIHRAIRHKSTTFPNLRAGAPSCGFPSYNLRDKEIKTWKRFPTPMNQPLTELLPSNHQQAEEPVSSGARGVTKQNHSSFISSTMQLCQISRTYKQTSYKLVDIRSYDTFWDRWKYIYILYIYICYSML